MGALWRASIAASVLVSAPGAAEEPMRERGVVALVAPAETLFDACAARAGVSVPRGNELDRLEDEVLPILFTEYLRDFDGCLDGDASTDLQRGNIVPRIEAVAHGAFTRAGARQELDAVRVGECNADKNFTTRKLLVREAGRAVAIVTVEGSPLLVADVDHDGRLEVVLGSRLSGEHSAAQEARLVRLGAGGSVQLVADFGETYSEACGPLAVERAVDCSVIKVGRDDRGSPIFIRSRRRAACKD